MWKRVRKWLRIAVTAVALLVCGLLMGLWVRSYTYCETLHGRISKSYRMKAWSSAGSAKIVWTPNPQQYRDDGKIIRREVNARDFETSPWSLGFDRQRGIRLSTPYWFILSMAATIAVLPWIKWRSRRSSDRALQGARLRREISVPAPKSLGCEDCGDSDSNQLDTPDRHDRGPPVT